MMNTIHHRYASATILVIVLTSCTWSDPVQVEQDFGQWVKQMIEQQKVLPANSPSAPVSSPSIDGNSAINSLEQYRSSQKKNVVRNSLESLAE